MSFPSPSEQRSPQCFRRSASLRLPGETIRNIPRIINKPDGRVLKLGDLHCGKHDSKERLTPDDLDNVSLLSSSSAGGYDCSFVPLNGTTFSGRANRYVHHCSTHAGLSEEYLTPTQRAQKQIRKLKSLLFQAKKELEQKDNEIYKLTKEIVELKFDKTKFSPDEKSDSSDVVTVKENSELNSPSQDAVDGIDYLSPSRSRDMQSSSDSGHFDDMYSSSKDFNEKSTCDAAVLTDIHGADWYVLKTIYEKKIEELCRVHSDEIQNLKEKHNDKVEALLQKLSEVNGRYCELVPGYDQARHKITELEKQLDEASKLLSAVEQTKQQHQDNTAESSDQNMAEQDTGLMNRVSVDQLVEQLQITRKELENVRDTEMVVSSASDSNPLLSAREAVSLWVLAARKAMYRKIVESKNASKAAVDPEVTLQFLKSAVYYFLTDPENHQGHLRAIESILGFTEDEIRNIEKMRPYQ